jgi:hypothetical protein
MDQMDPTIYGNAPFVPNLVWHWYNWGAIVAFVLALGATFWVFFDAQRRGRESILWKVVAVVSLILIIPSVILRIDPFLGTRVQRAVYPLAYLGLLAGVAALVTLFAYSLGVGVTTVARVCPNCGREQDPSWDHCPYCSPEPVIASPLPATQVAEPPPPPPPPLSPPPLEPTRVPGGAGFPEPAPFAGAPGPAKTEMLQREPPQLAWLIQRSGPRAGKEFRLAEVTNIGRDASQNEVVVDEPSVSRQHARARLEGGQFVLYDLASANGTFVNDEQIQKQTLLDGDAVRFGREEFRFMEVKQPES